MHYESSQNQELCKIVESPVIRQLSGGKKRDLRASGENLIEGPEAFSTSLSKFYWCRLMSRVLVKDSQAMLSEEHCHVSQIQAKLGFNVHCVIKWISVGKGSLLVLPGETNKRNEEIYNIDFLIQGQRFPVQELQHTNACKSAKLIVRQIPGEQSRSCPVPELISK